MPKYFFISQFSLVFKCARVLLLSRRSFAIAVGDLTHVGLDVLWQHFWLFRWLAACGGLVHWEEILDREWAVMLEGDPGYVSTEVMWTETQSVTGCGFTDVGMLHIECGLTGVFLLNHDKWCSTEPKACWFKDNPSKLSYQASCLHFRTMVFVSGSGVFCVVKAAVFLTHPVCPTGISAGH